MNLIYCEKYKCYLMSYQVAFVSSQKLAHN